MRFGNDGYEIMNLRELSEQLGLSQTTVSRALNGYPEVSEKTRKRIQDAAKEFGYRPSTIAQNLATGKAKAIGHILPLSQEEFVNPIFTDFIAGAGEVYSDKGYHMVLSVVSDQDEETAYRDMTARRLVDGMIVHGPRIVDARVDLLEELNMPFVVHGRSTENTPDHSWMDVNNRGAFHRATDLLLDLGHRRISLLNGDETMGFAVSRRQGYLDAFADRDINVDPGLMRSGDMTERYGYRRAAELLDADNPPTAFLVSSVVVAMGIERLLSDRGLELAKDVSIVTFDDQISYLHIGGDIPKFTSTRSSVRAAGKRCADMLIDKIENPQKKIENTLWEAELTLGTSTGPVPK